MSRIVCWFSCGAASAVATKMAIEANRLAPEPKEIVVAYTEVLQEHDDNKRFLSECEAWFGVPITILRNDRYQADIYTVFDKVGYLVGPRGAACTRLLKKEVRRQFERPSDSQVFGFTIEERDRYDRFLDANNIDVSVPLIDYGLTKQDCLAVIAKAGIAIPAMYRLGYKNNNCIGCVKGGAGYWNKIRIDFPEVFDRMAEQELAMGRTICKHNGERVYLKNLPPNAGNYQSEQNLDCGVVCYAAYDLISENADLGNAKNGGDA